MREKIAAIDRDRTLSDYRSLAGPLQIDAAIVVEAARTLAESLDLLAQARCDPFVSGIVAGADPDLEPEELLARLGRHPHLLGLRVVIAFAESRSDDREWLKRCARACASHNIVLELLATPRQLPLVADLQQGQPGLRLVIDHCGRPQVACGVDPLWLEGLQLIARETSARCKLSGLVERAGYDWDAARLVPFVAQTVEAFGPHRLAFASNWPVLELAGSLQNWLLALEHCLNEIGVPDAGRDAIFGGTAKDWYRQLPGEGR